MPFREYASTMSFSFSFFDADVAALGEEPNSDWTYSELKIISGTEKLQFPVCSTPNSGLDFVC